MSNLLYMDETNCNGVYAIKGNNTIATTLTTATNNNISNGNNNDNNNSNSNLTGNMTMSNCNNSTSNIINNTNNINNISIMNVTVEAMTAAVANANVNATGNGIITATLPASVSNEDLSQSLSEYTDADESISAPTEFLAEFLSAVMLKDYKKALKYCKLILQYEPNNVTAKEFYPLIIEKLRAAAASDSDENYNKSSSPEPALELQSSDPSAGESDEAAFEDQQIGYINDYGLPDDNFNSHELNVSSSRSGSLSESVDNDDVVGEEEDGDDDDDDELDCDINDDVDDDDDDDVDDDDNDDDDDEDDNDDGEDVLSSSGDDLPIDDPNSIGAAAGTGNNSLSSRNSSSDGGGGGRSRSDNTTHSYSSLLLEEDDDIVIPINLKFTKELSSPDLDVSNGNKLPSTSCSDSESPTEPLTQRLAAILRSKCGVSSAGDNY